MATKAPKIQAASKEASAPVAATGATWQLLESSYGLDVEFSDGATGKILVDPKVAGDLADDNGVISAEGVGILDSLASKTPGRPQDEERKDGSIKRTLFIGWARKEPAAKGAVASSLKKLAAPLATSTATALPRRKVAYSV